LPADLHHISLRWQLCNRPLTLFHPISTGTVGFSLHQRLKPLAKA
jgi:hypothetical protein